MSWWWKYVCNYDAIYARVCPLNNSQLLVIFWEENLWNNFNISHPSTSTSSFKICIIFYNIFTTMVFTCRQCTRVSLSFALSNFLQYSKSNERASLRYRSEHWLYSSKIFVSIQPQNSFLLFSHFDSWSQANLGSVNQFIIFEKSV